jgi:hypothetical protein
VGDRGSSPVTISYQILTQTRENKMNMPGVGNQFFALPQKVRVAVEAGMSMWELQLTTPFDNTQKIFRLWDARVFEDVQTGTTKIRYNFVWYRGDDAYVEFRPDNRGICVAFVPDDPMYHNRVMLASMLPQNRIKVMRIHTPEGAIPGKTAHEYLKCVWDTCFEWHVVKKTHEGTTSIIAQFKNLPDADALLYRMRADISDEKASEREKVWIIQSNTDEIREIIGKYRGAWTQSQEFQNSIKPKIQKAINDRTSGMAKSTNIVQMLIDAAATMTDTDRARLSEVFAGKASNNTVAAPSTASPDSPNPAEDLSGMHMSKLRTIAKAKGVVSKDKTKEQIIKEIEAKVEAEKAAIVSPNVAAESIADGILPSYDQFKEDDDEDEVIVT